MVVHGAAIRIFYDMSVFVQQTIPRIPEIEIIFSIRAKAEGMDRVVVLLTANPPEQQFL